MKSEQLGVVLEFRPKHYCCHSKLADYCPDANYLDRCSYLKVVSSNKQPW